MASEPRKGLPSFWSTHIAKAMVGDQPCDLSVWLSGHYDLDKRERDDHAKMTQWKLDHTAQLNGLEKHLIEEGWTVKKEVFFRVTGTSAIVSGKADIIASKKDLRSIIFDVKSGKPRESDIAQVLLEMVLIPLAWSSPTMLFNGGVVYPDNQVPLTPKNAADFKGKLFAKLRELARSERPAARPGRDACRFCDVSDADCAERYQETQVVMTEEF